MGTRLLANRRIGKGFPKSARLTRRSEFLSLNRGGRKVYTPHFLVITKPNDLGESRLGITVSARVGKAVVRNRVKRLVREFFRCHRHECPYPQDVVVVARKGAGGLSLEQVRGELGRALGHRGGRGR